jgi:HK97 family phage prohead protease
VTGLVISRSTPVDVHVTGGRTVEAYAAVFDRDAEIVDPQGHYLEQLDRASFNKAIHDASPQGGREHWTTSVFYNHGLTLHGESSSQFSIPVARTRHIEADSTGVLTGSEYADTSLGNDILELIKQGAIRAQSFTGRIFRSTPELRRGQKYRPGPDGTLVRVRRLEMGLREYGPTPIPAYDAAAVIGVRSALLQVLEKDPAVLRALLDTTQDEDETVQEPAPVVEGSVTDPPDGSADSDAPPEEPQETAPEHAARNDEWLTHYRAALRARGI